MSEGRFQAWVAAQLVLPPERWALRAIAFGGSLLAIFAAERAAGSTSPAVVFLVGLIALLATFRPDSHVSSVAIALLAWRWLAGADDPLGWPVLVVAVGLLAMHAALALMAATPERARLPRSVAIRWAVRCVWVVSATAASWVFVLALDARSLGGSVVMNAAAIAAVAAAVVGVTARSLAGADAPSD